MKEIVKFFDGLPWIVKLILALPGLDSIAWGTYRIAKGIDKKDTVLLIAGIIWLLVGWAILWIVDIITILLNKNPTVFA